MEKFNGYDMCNDLLDLVEKFEFLEAQEREGLISFEELHKIKKGVLKEIREKYKIEENNVNCDIDGSQVQAVFKNMKW